MPTIMQHATELALPRTLWDARSSACRAFDARGILFGIAIRASKFAAAGEWERSGNIAGT